MDRSTHSTTRPKHLEQNLNRLVVDIGNNKPTSISQNQTAPPTLRNIAEKNGIKLYPFIQQSEYKYKDVLNSSETDRSNLVEAPSSADGEVNIILKKSACEITLSSRPTLSKKKIVPTLPKYMPYLFLNICLRMSSEKCCLRISLI